MLRILMAGLATLAASGCTFGLPSAVDAAPFEARAATAPFADGEYCTLEQDEAGKLVVRRLIEDARSICSTLTWNATRRLFVMRDGEGKEAELKLVDLGEGFLLVQLPAGTGKSDSPYAFTLLAAAVEGEAFVILPLPDSESILPVAARYPGLTLSTYTPSRPPFTTPVVPEGAQPPPPEPDHYYISAGSPADIRDFARDILRIGIRAGNEDRRDNARVWKGEGLIVRDPSSSADPSPANHAPSPAQQRDIDALLAKLQALASPP